MRVKVSTTFLITILVSLVCFPSVSRSLCVDLEKPSPSFTLPDLEGKQVSLDSFRGKIVLLAFWASWCPRCEEELTFLQGVYKTSPDIVVIAINQESQNISSIHVDRIKKTLMEWKIDFPVLLDKELEVWDLFCINALPTSIIIDKNGNIRYAEANYYWATQDSIAEVISKIRLGK